jgi:hypothetical protein
LDNEHIRRIIDQSTKKSSPVERELRVNLKVSAPAGRPLVEVIHDAFAEFALSRRWQCEMIKEHR